MIQYAYLSDVTLQEKGSTYKLLGHVVKMGSQGLWCAQCPPDHIVPKYDVPGSLYHIIRSSFEEFNSDGQVSSVPVQKTVPVGSDYQAELPNVIIPTGKGDDVDDKAYDLRWIEQRIWPQPQKEHEVIAFGEELKYHHELCTCSIQGTLECVRLHIEEKRKLLKDELGDAFFVWGFDEMGEIVAEHWTDEEELAFHDAVRGSPLSFWCKLQDVFPSKCMADLVSYYFNVFMLRRRGIQNRVIPENIDSDDDEMVLDNDGKDSDNNLLDSDEEDNESQEESQVDDAIHGHEEENGVFAWSRKDDSNKKIRDNFDGLFMVDIPGQEKICVEPSSKDDSLHEQLKTMTKVSFGGGDSSRMIKSLEVLAWEQTTNYGVAEGCAKEVWNSPSALANQDDVDKLISTNGLMEEFFGTEIWKSRK